MRTSSYTEMNVSPRLHSRELRQVVVPHRSSEERCSYCTAVQRCTNALTLAESLRRKSSAASCRVPEEQCEAVRSRTCNRVVQGLQLPEAQRP